ncbi:MAG TPA: OmpA family protein [Polyangiaceae bacterium]|nr:OmpA family protein [Polyangiaceae bacterium]
MQSEAVQLNPSGTRDAQEALAAAEAAHKESAGSDREKTAAYVAQRKSELAVAGADEARARQERERADQAYQAQLEQQLSASRQQVEQLQAQQTASEKALKEQVAWRKQGENLVVTLSGVVFDTGGHNLSADARKRLDVVAHALKDNPTRAVTISGYTDNRGRSETNRALSQKRADAVKAYLERQGVPASRLASEGRGDANPVASNDTEEGRADNRRVEITMHPPGEAPERQLVKGTDRAPKTQSKSK